MNFPGKQPNEIVMMVVHKHVIVHIRVILIFIVSSIIPIAIFISFWSRHFPLNSGGTASIVGYLGAGLYFLYSLAILLIAWLNEEFDIFIITNHRLIDITQVSFLKRTVAITPLTQIQDVTSSVQGVLGTILNYGRVNIETASGNANAFNMDHVPDPALVARKILSLTEKSRGQASNDLPLGEDDTQSNDLMSDQA